MGPDCTPWRSVDINSGHSSLGISMAAMEAMKFAAWVEVWWSAAPRVIKAFHQPRPEVETTFFFIEFLISGSRETHFAWYSSRRVWSYDEKVAKEMNAPLR